MKSILKEKRVEVPSRSKGAKLLKVTSNDSGKNFNVFSKKVPETIAAKPLPPPSLKGGQTTPCKREVINIYNNATKDLKWQVVDNHFTTFLLYSC